MTSPRENSPKEIIYAASIDADGCVFNDAYREARNAYIDHFGKIDAETEKKILLENNPELIKFITSRGLDLNATIKKLFVGSARQSHPNDKSNSEYNETDSFFTSIRTLADALGFDLDKYLLADTYNLLKPDEVFNLNEEEYQFYHWYYDENKVSILYAQMQKLAKENPNATIYFDFLDDRLVTEENKKDILFFLRDYFVMNKHLIPKNVILGLNHYEGAQVTSLHKIIGEGPIDKHFESTLRFVSEKGGAALERNNDFADYFDRFGPKPTPAVVPTPEEFPVPDVPTYEAYATYSTPNMIRKY